MKHVGKLEKVKLTGNKKIKRMNYHRVLIVDTDGELRTIALMPLELRKARKRASNYSILKIKTKWYHRLYAYLCYKFG